MIERVFGKFKKIAILIWESALNMCQRRVYVITIVNKIFFNGSELKKVLMPQRRNSCASYQDTFSYYTFCFLIKFY